MGTEASFYSLGTYFAEADTRADSDAIVYFVSFALMVSLLLWIGRLSRLPLSEYFALKAFRGWDLLAGAGAVAICYSGFDVMYAAFGVDNSSTWWDDLYKDAVGRGWVVPLALTLVLGAPVLEEGVFRGVLFRGWAASRIGPAGTVVLTSALWTLIHTQYVAPELVILFCDGLVLGFLRHRSGSLLLPMALHALINLQCVLDAGTRHGFGG